VSSSTCNSGTACSYTCSTGWSNCNTTAPNTGGCECNTPSCCGTGCQTTHSTGLPNLYYYDCNPHISNTQTQSQLVSEALEACTAFTGSVSMCATGLVCKGAPGIGPYVCDGSGGINCTTCWSYGGTDFAQTQNCSCPPQQTVIGTWN
jgi:hypothetical protein